ncbi:MAG: FMN-binding protein [Desulforegulaceae bacterium]|nr:FMN-binding protein [Desulforegulaceae bacterium]
MSDNFKSILFTIVLCTVASLLLTLAASRLKPLQEKNALVNKEANILMAAGYIGSVQPPAEKIREIFKEKIIPANSKENPDLELYLTYADSGEISGYIVPFESSGLWGRIYGYIALENDGITISGVSIYQHQETPGLGAEIDKRPFLDNYTNKKIIDKNNNFKGVMVAKGRVADSISISERDHYVDGISGATLTGRFLGEGMIETLEKYEPISKKFRNNNIDFNTDNTTKKQLKGEP